MFGCHKKEKNNFFKLPFIFTKKKAKQKMIKKNKKNKVNDDLQNIQTNSQMTRHQ